MKKFANQILLAALALGFVGAAGAWTGNASTPPSNNAPAPLNVTVAKQSKSGILGVGGLGVFGKGFVSTNKDYPLAANLQFGINGSVGAAEYCNEAGDKCVTVDQILKIINGGIDTDTNSALTCSATPDYTSTVKGTPGYAPVNIPASCTGAGGCVIKHQFTTEAKGVEKVYNTYYTNFRQDSVVDGTPSDWWSSYNQYSTLKNGDKTYGYVVLPIINKERSATWIGLFDDFPNKNAEQKTSQFSAYDGVGVYGQKIWFCTYATSSVIPVATGA